MPGNTFQNAHPTMGEDLNTGSLNEENLNAAINTLRTQVDQYGMPYTLTNTDRRVIQEIMSRQLRSAGFILEHNEYSYNLRIGCNIGVSQDVLISMDNPRQLAEYLDNKLEEVRNELNHFIDDIKNKYK